MSTLTGVTTTDGGAIITIPAGKQFVGSVTLAGTLAAGPGVGAALSTPNITVEGTGADPAPGSVVAQLALASPTINILSLLGVTSTDSVTTPQVIATAPPGNAITLKLHTSSATQCSAVAVGGLV